VVTVVQAPRYGKSPMTMTCPHCSSQIQTSTKSEAGPLAWIIGGVLCFMGLWCCACIPCCIDDLNRVEHRCPNCNAFLGAFKGGM
jgi:lipopolysaccharide-induced tumor necrosis factor-alpha factor